MAVQPEVVIEVRRGMVVHVYTDVPDVRVVLVDWDLRERQEGSVATVEAVASLHEMSDEVRNEYEDALTRAC